MIEAINIYKKFSDKEILSNISFCIKKGEIVGLLGLNGSGKTTLIKILTSYLQPSSGVINICNKNITEDPSATKKLISYLPENNPLYINMYVSEYLKFIADIYDYRPENVQKKISHILKKCYLYDKKNEKIKTLSKGYKQRVGIAQCLIHDPKVLILDEPTSGLDPKHAIEIRKIIKEVSENMAILFSTHIMEEVRNICDRVITIENRNIVESELYSSTLKMKLK